MSMPRYNANTLHKEILIIGYNTELADKVYLLMNLNLLRHFLLVHMNNKSMESIDFSVNEKKLSGSQKSK